MPKDSRLISSLPSLSSKSLLGVILLLALALRAPGWFTQDEKSRFRLFEPDEYQHVQIAVYQIQCIDSTLLQDWNVVRKIFNARGFGIQLGTLAWIGHQLWDFPLTTENLVLLGRILSTIYSLLLITVVFYLGYLLSGKQKVGLMAALLLAICDLNITYSHYALPASSYVFWSFAFVLSCCLLLRQLYLHQSSKNLLLYIILLAWTAAATFAIKFDFIPVALGGCLFPILAWQKKIAWSHSLGLGLSFVLLFLLSFGVLTSFNFSLERIEYSFWDLYKQNKDVIQEDQHWLFNPILYLIAVVAGTSLPATAMSGFGLFKTWKKHSKIFPYLLVFIAFVGLEFGIRWSSDIPFIRRANIFMPAITLLAAYGWVQIKNKSWRMYLGIAMVLYTLGLTLISQSNAWWDTRYAARAYLEENHADQRIKYGSYAHAAGMPKGITLKEEEEILVLHETAYGRYWRSFTTPFRIPRCCEEVYHCGEEDCRFMQHILRGEHPDYQLIKHFRTREYFPERSLYKKYLGNFETFLGDVLILKKD
ncbi:MAG: hypothetical protein KTR30_30910 [Saprospiraceae bacterium]|nr:hypothetical protein [Saprospiraceae bacterium]